MKRLALISCVTVLAFAQTTVRHGEAVVTADRVEQTGAVRHLSGKVTIETDAVLLHADQVDYNDATGDIVAHGEVHLKLK